MSKALEGSLGGPMYLADREDKKPKFVPKIALMSLFWYQKNVFKASVVVSVEWEFIPTHVIELIGGSPTFLIIYL